MKLPPNDYAYGQRWKRKVAAGASGILVQFMYYCMHRQVRTYGWRFGRRH